jgi:hypothetical protein
MKHDDQVDYIIDTLLDEQWMWVKVRRTCYHLVSETDLIYTRNLVRKQVTGSIEIPTVCKSQLHVREISTNVDHMVIKSMQEIQTEWLDTLCRNCLRKIRQNQKRFGVRLLKVKRPRTPHKPPNKPKYFDNKPKFVPVSIDK